MMSESAQRFQVELGNSQSEKRRNVLKLKVISFYSRVIG